MGGESSKLPLFSNSSFRNRAMSARAFADERRAAILSLLDQASSVQVADLARTLGVSTVTARADLDALERDGKLRRTHGGAVSLSKTITVSIQDRRVNVNAEAKRAIARHAARLVHDGDSLVVDSGTTALEFVRCLAPYRDVTVVTADFTIADFIDRSLPGVEAVLLGGSLRKGHRYLYGPLALRSLEVLHADCAFLCPTSFVPGCGFMTNYAQMAEVKTAMLASANRRVVLMDSSKVGAPGLIRFALPGEVDLVVVEADPDGLIAAELEETSVRLEAPGNEAAPAAVGASPDGGDA